MLWHPSSPSEVSTERQQRNQPGNPTNSLLCLGFKGACVKAGMLEGSPRTILKVIDKNWQLEKQHRITKLKHLVTSFVSYIQGRTINGLGEYSASQWGSSTQGIFGWGQVYGALEEATQKQAVIGMEVGDFLIRLRVLFCRVRWAS